MVRRFAAALSDCSAPAVRSAWRVDTSRRRRTVPRLPFTLLQLSNVRVNLLVGSGCTSGQFRTLVLLPVDDPKKEVLGRWHGRLREFHVNAQRSGLAANHIMPEASHPSLALCHNERPAILLDFDALLQFALYQLGKWRVIPRPSPPKPSGGRRTLVGPILLTSQQFSCFRWDLIFAGHVFDME